MLNFLCVYAFEDNKCSMNEQCFQKVIDSHNAEGSKTSEDQKIAKYL